MATVKEFRMSQERYDELKKELDYSKTTRADEIAELIKEARGFGDLSENSEYDEAKTSRASSIPALPSWRRFCSTPSLWTSRDGLRQNLHRLPCGGHQSG